jgi:hypothetical protein
MASNGTKCLVFLRLYHQIFERILSGSSLVFLHHFTNSLISLSFINFFCGPNYVTALLVELTIKSIPLLIQDHLINGKISLAIAFSGSLTFRTDETEERIYKDDKTTNH